MNVQPDPYSPDDDNEPESTALADLADAVRHPAAPKAPPVLSRGWRMACFLMRSWATILFGLGLLLGLVFAPLIWAAGAPGFEIVRTSDSIRVHGWGLAVVFGVICVILSAIQSAIEKRLRRKKLQPPPAPI